VIDTARAISEQLI